MTKKFLIVGASGKTGLAVANELLKAGYKVRGCIHKRDERSKSLEKLGVEVTVTDIFNHKSYEEALDGITGAYFLPIFHPNMLYSAVAFREAVLSSNLKSIVHLNQWIANPDHPSLLSRQLWYLEKLFSSIDKVTHTTINPGMFADNFLRTIDFASILRFYPVLIGSSRSAPISNEDLARVIAKILIDPEPHNRKVYRPTGAKLLTGFEMAEAISEALGYKVFPCKIPFSVFLRIAKLQDLNSFEVTSFKYYVDDHRRGVFEWNNGVNNVVEAITGEPPEDFVAIAKRYAKQKFAERSFINIAKMLFQFSILPFISGYSLEKVEHTQLHPKPSNPRYSFDNPTWRMEHSKNGRLNSNCTLKNEIK